MTVAVAKGSLHLGYEIGTGDPVGIPLRHLAVTGQTQESGKTTTLEALISRAEGLRAVAFVTKRGERSFQTGRRIKPYFRERADWQFVASVLEATLRERLKFERSWIIRASKGARSLADVQRNVREALVNAARHGRASAVRLELSAQDHHMRIRVTDNGRGFPFRGQYDHAALTRLKLGPVCLKERVESLGGSLAIASTDAGARVDVILPLRQPGAGNGH